VSSTARTAEARIGFGGYTAWLAAAAVGASAAASLAWPGHLGFGDARLWLFATFVLIGELLPIRIPRGTHVEEVTISSAFALALLIVFGAATAVAVYAGACLAADALRRTAPLKALFNAGQSALSISAAGLVLAALLGHPASFAGGQVPAILAAAGVFFLLDHGLALTAVALLGGEPFVVQLRRDAAFHAWTNGFLLTLTPMVVAGAKESLWLVPLLFCPMLAIYFGGRQAVTSAHRALHDELTGLPNRALLYKRLEEIAESGRDALAVVLVDLDDFRAVNDTLGHQHGDTLLEHVAERLDSAVEQDEFLARFGGDEFAIVRAALTDAAETETMAKRIGAALAAPFSIKGIAIEVRASMGIATAPSRDLQPHELVRHADVALDRAKERRTLYELYSEANDEYSIDRLVLAGQLRHGVESGELVLYYQPKLALSGDLPPCAEALVRWDHPDLGLLGPQAFVPLAEQTGLVERLTDVVLNAALAQCAAWRQEGLDARMGVNLSAHSLLDSGLPGRVADCLRRWSLPASCLQVEITETEVVADIERARKVLGTLHAAGVGCAIDDFGTGYSSLAQLQRLQVDEIKIDKSFVINMDSSEDDATIVRSTIELGRSLGLVVTAEGVESEGVCRQLAELGCNYAQGFHIGHPLPAEGCGRLLAAASQRTMSHA
jgi:diguanylate cyclase (GGDEF)-like protein